MKVKPHMTKNRGVNSRSSAVVNRQSVYVVGLISDTHGLMRPEIAQIFDGVDLIVHGGDVGGRGVLDAYLFVDDADRLYAEYAARGVEFTRALANTPWHSREFVVKDCDGRLLAFGARVE